MASNLPTARQVDWISIIPHLAIMWLIMFAYFMANSTQFIIFGALTYLVLSYSLRNFVPLDHKVGMRLVHKKEFQNAVPYFHKSYDFSNKYSWIDKYRYVTLLSSSKMCYKEIALNNIAFCYGQLGEGEKAVEYYSYLHKEYPDNEMAKAALNLINSCVKKGSF